ncbi:MAG: hypothetical protein IT324_22055 [Anaerolineae bacterium]|nr:hypothetical protein [Anaerolineae bacterium]
MTLPIRPPIIVHHMASLDDGRNLARNSLEAIRACLEARAALIEIDVTALANDDYLLVHDPALESETTGKGAVGECPAAQARDLHFVQKGQATAFRVPLLSEVVALFGEYPGVTRLQIDFKNMIPFPNGEPLRRLLHLIEPLGDRVIVSTGADWQLRKLRTLAPRLDLGLDVHFYIDARPPVEPGTPIDSAPYPTKRGAYGYWDDHPLASQRFWPTPEYLEDRCSFLVGLVPGISTFYISHVLLAQSLDDGFNWVEALHARGVKLDAWTLDADNPTAAANAKRLLPAGVDQFTTNTPNALAAILNG